MEVLFSPDLFCPKTLLCLPDLSLCFSSQAVSLRGVNVALRYIGGIKSHLYGGDIYQKNQIDEWIDFVPKFRVSKFEEACTVVDKLFQTKTWLVGYGLSIADLAVWAGLVGAGCRWESLMKSGKYPNLVRWFNSIATERALSSGRTLSHSRAVRNGSFEYDLPYAEFGKVKVRFAPDPSGYLHIGHAKTALLNQYFSIRYQGELSIRIDDTNPSKENNGFVDKYNLLKDIDTLGIKYNIVTHSSDYFPELMEMAEKLIREGKAYVDDTPCQKMREERRDSVESRCRNNSVEDNLDLWQEMIASSQKGLLCCLRGKLEMNNLNMSLRDPVYYQCNLTPHHRVGTKYKLYPTYDFCCPFVDSVEGITHAFRSRVYLYRNEQYHRIQMDMGLRMVHIYDFSPLKISYTVLSKRKLLWFVQNGIVESWDDPRLPTVQGIVRRGLKIEAIKQFILEHGPSKHVSTIDWDKLWAINKRIIDPGCPRHTALNEKDRVMVILTNGPKNPYARILSRREKYKAAGMKVVNCSIRLWVDYADAKEIEVDDEITLKDWGNAIVNDIKRDEDRVITQLVGVLHPRGDFRKTKLKLNCLSESDVLVKLSLVYFGHLITTPSLDGDLDDDKMREVVNHFSKETMSAFGDPDFRNLNRGDINNVERKGYFRCDVPFVEPSQPVVLFYIPDGETATAS